MKTEVTTHTLMTVPAIMLSALVSLTAYADNDVDANALIYNNRAYVHSIQGDPNPVAGQTVQRAEIVYVDNNVGQAIYSYASNGSQNATAFNVEYVDNAYGQAIYSYPNNNAKFRLDLAQKTSDKKEGLIVPVSTKAVNKTVRGGENGSPNI